MPQVLFNFRADRMVEISKAFEYEEFSAFDRKRWPKVRRSCSSSVCCCNQLAVLKAGAQLRPACPKKHTRESDAQVSGHMTSTAQTHHPAHTDCVPFGLRAGGCLLRRRCSRA
jgi:bisphosphoglycerate-independent phosphoglycerate mutase (AlkP superfamily)